MDSDTRSFPQWLKRRRLAYDLTQHDLALRVGCSVSLLQKIEAGERRPSKQIAARLVAALDVELDEREALARLARASAK